MSVSTSDVHTVRVPVEAMDRADQLLPELAAAPEYAGLRLTRAAVVRLALVAGLAELERRRRAAAGEVAR
jgi:hypothetical protein